jgi:hypothetical protein
MNETDWLVILMNSGSNYSNFQSQAAPNFKLRMASNLQKNSTNYEDDFFL